jgi:hypothetical protein
MVISSLAAIMPTLRGKSTYPNCAVFPNHLYERFNGTLRREVLNAEWFTSIRQAQIVIETWLKQYNHIRPHQALNMRPPMPETLSESGT